MLVMVHPKTLMIIFTKFLFHPPLSPLSDIPENLTPLSEPLVIAISPPPMPFPVVLLLTLLVLGQ